MWNTNRSLKRVVYSVKGLWYVCRKVLAICNRRLSHMLFFIVVKDQIFDNAYKIYFTDSVIIQSLADCSFDKNPKSIMLSKFFMFFRFLWITSYMNNQCLRRNSSYLDAGSPVTTSFSAGCPLLNQ